MANREVRFVKAPLGCRGEYRRFTSQSLGNRGAITEVEECEPGTGVVALGYVAAAGALAFLLCAGSDYLGLFFSLRARMAAELSSRF